MFKIETEKPKNNCTPIFSSFPLCVCSFSCSFSKLSWLFICLLICLSTCQDHHFVSWSASSEYLPQSLSFCLSIFFSIYLLSVHLSICFCFSLMIKFLSVHQTVCLFFSLWLICPSIRLYLLPSCLYLSLYLVPQQAIVKNCFNFSTFFFNKHLRLCTKSICN